MKKYDFLLAGVGGQGTVSAGNILAEVGLALGYDVKKAEIHGMAQRGGMVESHVRWGEKVYSPMVVEGEVDFLLAFEMLEAARWAPYLHKQALSLVNDYRINPLPVSLKQAVYPHREEISARLTAGGARLIWLAATETARRLGNPAVAGTVLLGALSTFLDGTEENWLPVIAGNVPARFADLNERAFCEGRAARG